MAIVEEIYKESYEDEPDEDEPNEDVSITKIDIPKPELPPLNLTLVSPDVAKQKEFKLEDSSNKLVIPKVDVAEVKKDDNDTSRSSEESHASQRKKKPTDNKNVFRRRK